MSKELNKPIKTPKGDLMYVYITGDGKNTAMPGEPERNQFVASVKLNKNSEEFKLFKQQIDKVWIPYKEKYKIKGAPDTTGYKVLKEEHPTDKDEYGDPIMVESDDVIITFKTNLTFPDGKEKKVKVFQPSGADVTSAIHAADWTIGNGSKGIIHGVASPNNVGGSHKVSLYLDAVQFAGEIIKYTGTDIEVDSIEGTNDLELDVPMDDVEV